MSKKPKSKNEFFRRISSSMEKGIEAMRTGKKLTSRTVTQIEEPPVMRAADIVHLHKNMLNMSQAVFASIFCVSPKTVQAWEQDLNKPKGPTLRLLHLIKEKPEMVLKKMGIAKSM